MIGRTLQLISSTKSMSMNRHKEGSSLARKELSLRHCRLGCTAIVCIQSLDYQDTPICVRLRDWRRV
jgi:hypothetical protein